MITPVVDTLTEICCPNCGYKQHEEMPMNACIWFWQCSGCQTLVRPKAGDCCVYCSYATIPCPPVQLNGKCCNRHP
ncbi:GDCCVxC domain-containing (seleno)protein [Pontibacterium sp.]|uniref:GDCCVxC domain-containing (seleno)protein n=1 Tax=Pontibacterium sp. TaxID=2036026 RepID=UPI003564A43D